MKWNPDTVLCPLDSTFPVATIALMKTNHLTISERSAYRSLEDVVGCKWSAAVVAAIRRGVTRPGKLERYIPGISTKVLTERLRKLLDYGLVTKEDQSGVSLHVEYRLTPVGERLAGIIEQLHALQADHIPQSPSAQPSGKNPHA
jgi:DNA-binding HxlR family transcriptional regulator